MKIGDSIKLKLAITVLTLGTKSPNPIVDIEMKTKQNESKNPHPSSKQNTTAPIIMYTTSTTNATDTGRLNSSSIVYTLSAGVLGDVGGNPEEPSGATPPNMALGRRNFVMSYIICTPFMTSCKKHYQRVIYYQAKAQVCILCHVLVRKQAIALFIQ